MAINRGEPAVKKHLPDKKNNKRGSVQNCVSGKVPSRLVYAWQVIPPGDRQMQVVFEWEAPWPEKYVIECHEGVYIVARSDCLDWETVIEFLQSAYDQADCNLGAWYALVLARLRAEGGGCS